MHTTAITIHTRNEQVINAVLNAAIVLRMRTGGQSLNAHSSGTPSNQPN